MKTIQLYPPVTRSPRYFPGVKKRTLPNQCMSLAEMFRRFVRREPLPTEKNGIYVESDYDLEKLAHLDRVEQDEILDEMKSKTEALKNKALKADSDESAKKVAQQAAQQATLDSSSTKQRYSEEGKGTAPVSGKRDGAAS